MNQEPVKVRKLPCVIQVGFSGSRVLFDSPPKDVFTQVQWERSLQSYLQKELAEYKEKLGLEGEYFYCGISQIAIGGDVVFARALAEIGDPHRLFLPQPLDDFLGAVNSKGVPDFTDEERRISRELAESENVIQQEVVSQSNDRHVRFREANAEILKVSDIVVAIQRRNPESKSGGASEFVERAKKTGKPVLIIYISVDPTTNEPRFESEWRLDCKPPFRKPTIPHELEFLHLDSKSKDRIPHCDEFTKPLKSASSRESKTRREVFFQLVFWIVSLHVLATLLATAALALHGVGGHSTANHATELHADEVQEPTNAADSGEKHGMGEGAKDGKAGSMGWLIPGLLLLELVVLLTGLVLHLFAHYSEAVRRWANARLVSELARSVNNIDPYYMYLGYLFRLPLPWRFRSLLRTLNVVHLRSSKNHGDSTWESTRDSYLAKRMKAQLSYYQDKLEKELPKLEVYDLIFKIFSVIAIVATFLKLILMASSLWSHSEHSSWPQLLGTFAVVAPVLAVAALSWAAALDLQARVKTFSEAVEFLTYQIPVVENATSQSEFENLVDQTEGVLLGEVSNWFSRRENTGV